MMMHMMFVDVHYMYRWGYLGETFVFCPTNATRGVAAQR